MSLLRILAVAATATVVAMGGALAAIVLSQDADNPVEPPAPGVSPARVLEQPERYDGRTLTITGRVNVLTDRAMTLGEQDLMVVAVGPRPRLQGRGFFVGDIVHASGTVRVLDAEGLREELGHTSLLPSQFQGFDSQPVLLATGVTTSHPAGRPESGA